MSLKVILRKSELKTDEKILSGVEGGGDMYKNEKEKKLKAERLKQ